MLSMLYVCQNSKAEILFKMLNTFILIECEVFNVETKLKMQFFRGGGAVRCTSAYGRLGVRISASIGLKSLKLVVTAPFPNARQQL